MHGSRVLGGVLCLGEPYPTALSDLKSVYSQGDPLGQIQAIDIVHLK